MATVYLQVFEKDECRASLSIDGAVECGRQDINKGEPPPVELLQSEQRNRLVLIPDSEKKFSRKWFAVSCDDAGVTICNLHDSHPIRLINGDPIPAGTSASFGGEVAIDLGRSRSLHVSSSQPSRDVPKVAHPYRMLDSIPLVPGDIEQAGATMTVGAFTESDSEAIVDLLKIALQVVQKASGSDVFFQAAARAATEIVGLDRAAILLRIDSPATSNQERSHAMLEPPSWTPVSEFLIEQVEGRSMPPVSQTVLSQVSIDRRTQIHEPDRPAAEPSESITKVHSIVASPILDCDSEVIGVLYGDRWSGQSAGGNRRISDLEGTLVEVLAGTVASGVARQKEERMRSNLAGFFSPAVAEALAARPELLEGRDTVVSVLFCDVRGFSTVTERLGPQKTIDWINDVLSELSLCVVARDGVLVDYVGDELMAMWGAPDAQADHARRAVDAAMAMLEAIEILRQRWSDRLPQRFGAGIGIDTGDARVGNVGSTLKFKYGALGNTVNCGSRLQAATKQLGVDCLVSEHTIVDASSADTARRLARLQVVGISQAISVFEVVRDPNTRWMQLREGYEAALADYESGAFGEATRQLGTLIQEFPEDRPSRMLLTRAVTQIDQPDADFSPVWVLTRK